MRARRETELPLSWRRGERVSAGSVTRGVLVSQLVVKDDYGPWTASTLRLSSEILLPADEVAGACHTLKHYELRNELRYEQSIRNALRAS